MHWNAVNCHYPVLRLEHSDCEALIYETLVQATHSSLVIELIEFGETDLPKMTHVEHHDEVVVQIVKLWRR